MGPKVLSVEEGFQILRRLDLVREKTCFRSKKIRLIIDKLPLRILTSDSEGELFFCPD
jgi:hypothetical protein